MDMENSDQKLKANGKEKQQQQDCSDGHVSWDRGESQPQPQPQKQRRVESGVIRQVDDQEVIKLAATAMTLNVRLRSSYSSMPHHMQDRALRLTRSLIDDSSPAAAAAPLSLKSRPNPTHLARALKKEFDSLYGPAWHCLVGKSFGSFVTHSPGGFLYFSIDNSLSVLLFKTEVQLVTEQQPEN